MLLIPNKIWVMMNPNILIRMKCIDGAMYFKLVFIFLAHSRMAIFPPTMAT